MSSTAHLDVIVGELTLVAGQRQSDATHLALLTPPRRARRDRRSDTVVVFLDLGGGGAGGLAKAMLDNFSRAFWHCSGPVTSALRHAIAAANAHLQEENRLMPVSHRRRGGLVCAVLRYDEAYLAQIGPAKALFAQGDTVTRLPATRQERLPLGVSRGLDISFSRHSFDPDDRLMLTGENWCGELPDKVLAATLGAEEVAEVMLTLERQAGDNPFSALVVESARSSESVEHVPVLSEEVESSQLAQQEPLTPPVAPTVDVEAISEPEPSAEMRYFDASSQLGEGVAQAEASAQLDDVEASWPPAQPLVGFALGRERFDRSRRGLRRVGKAFGHGIRTLLTRVLPEAEPAPARNRRRSRGSGADNVPMMAGIAVAIPLLVTVVVVTFYLQRGEADQHTALATQASEAVQVARQADPEGAYALWEAALQEVEEALRVAPEDQTLLNLRGEALANLDHLIGAVRPDLALLWDYGAGEDRVLTASRMQVYVLDAAEGQVTQHTLNQSRQGVADEQLRLVAYRGQVVGNNEIGELRDVLWLGAGGAWTADALLILTEDNRLLQHSLSWGLSWMPFDTRDAHYSARMLRPYSGKLYALDPTTSRMWRFHYTSEGFGAPESYFTVPPPDLSDTVDMTIDGAVWILLADARIYRFFAGQEQSFQISGLPQPFVRPVGLVSEGDASSGALYVADAGEQSIVALTKGGAFVYQIKADGDALAGLEAMAIEPDSRTLYLLASGRLYAVALPPVP